MINGGFHKAIYALCLKFTLCAHLFSLIQHHVFAHFLAVGALYALHHALNFYEIHPNASLLWPVYSVLSFHLTVFLLEFEAAPSNGSRAHSGLICMNQSSILKFTLAPVFLCK
jgi:hypothetical protein